ncbi:hypothetical protein [Ruegeria sp. THAF33]|uniref:hypothetical protein n=1 Tax=Ruegeria sp. THAF33 TaxID=2587853 RepID=UPI001267B9F6|nr:hypothetical protein [Ruegeria sp. THAF33]QFT73642.1 hypothetical protein FIU92_11415 [Ruegeria sp. THAF33]
MTCDQMELCWRERLYAIAAGLQSAGLAVIFLKFLESVPLWKGVTSLFLNNILGFFDLCSSYWGVILVALILSVLAVIVPIPILMLSQSVIKRWPKSKSSHRSSDQALWLAIAIFFILVLLAFVGFDFRVYLITAFVVLVAFLHVANSAALVVGYRLTQLSGRYDREAVSVQILSFFISLLFIIGGVVAVGDFTIFGNLKKVTP